MRVRLEEGGSPSVVGCGAGTIGMSVSSTLTVVGASFSTTMADAGTSCSVGAVGAVDAVGAVGAEACEVVDSSSVAAWIACTIAFASLTFCFSARLTVFSVYPFGSKTPSRIRLRLDRSTTARNRTAHLSGGEASAQKSIPMPLRLDLSAYEPSFA